MFLLPLLPAGDNRCQRQVRLNQAGKPVPCRSKGYIRVGDEKGPVLCVRHFEAAKPNLEEACLQATEV